MAIKFYHVDIKESLKKVKIFIKRFSQKTPRNGGVPENGFYSATPRRLANILYSIFAAFARVIVPLA